MINTINNRTSDRCDREWLTPNCFSPAVVRPGRERARLTAHKARSHPSVQASTSSSTVRLVHRLPLMAHLLSHPPTHTHTHTHTQTHTLTCLNVKQVPSRHINTSKETELEPLNWCLLHFHLTKSENRNTYGLFKWGSFPLIGFHFCLVLLWYLVEHVADI